METQDDEQQPGASPGSVGKTTAIVAIAVLATYIVATVYLAVRAALGAQDMEWTRDMYLFGGLEAIGFAAVGLFFGHQIQRQRVDEANTREARMRGLYMTGKAHNEAERAATLDRIVLLRGELDTLIQQRQRGAPRGGEEAQASLERIRQRLDEWFPAKPGASGAAYRAPEFVGGAPVNGRTAT